MKLYLSKNVNCLNSDSEVEDQLHIGGLNRYFDNYNEKLIEILFLMVL